MHTSVGFVNMKDSHEIRRNGLMLLFNLFCWYLFLYLTFVTPAI